jgi:hypothetical protein
MDIEVREAGREETSILRRLMQLYLCDIGTIGAPRTISSVRR